MQPRWFQFAIAATAAGAIAVALPTLPARSQHTFPGERSHCEAVLQANDPGARITLRSGPGTQYASRGYGLAGDRVYALTSLPPELDIERDAQGYWWHRVGFPGSGAIGWIRQDFLELDCIQYPDL